MSGSLYRATVGRAFARLYDRVLRVSEEAGLSDCRHALLAGASGATLEIGAGTGLNLAHYPEAVTELVLTEPGEHMVRRLWDAAAAGPRQAEVVCAPADRLPFANDRFDTVVCTLVLCTATSPGAALEEVKRVLRPGGRFLFIEHVRSQDDRIARWQDRLDPIHSFVADGCHPNRDTLAAIEASGLTVESVQHTRLPKAAAYLRPMIVGSAVASREP